MRFRNLTTVGAASVAAVLVLGALSACDSKVGQAAIVGGHRISESDLSGFVTSAGPSAKVLSAAKAAGQGVYPKTEVIQVLIQQQLFERTLAKNGGVPSAGELATLHDRAAATFLGTQLTGTKLDDYLQTTQSSYGYAGKYARTLLRTVELEAALAVAVKASSLADVSKAVNKLQLDVSVNPRYGKWQPTTLTLGGPSSSVPDFLQLGGASSASAAPTAPPSN